MSLNIFFPPFHFKFLFRNGSQQIPDGHKESCAKQRVVGQLPKGLLQRANDQARPGQGKWYVLKKLYFFKLFSHYPGYLEFFILDDNLASKYVFMDTVDQLVDQFSRQFCFRYLICYYSIISLINFMQLISFHDFIDIWLLYQTGAS